MPRRNQRSSRKRFFEEHYFEDEHEKTADDNANIIVKQRANTKSVRQSFFEDLGNGSTSAVSETFKEQDYSINAGTTVDGSAVEFESVDALEQLSGKRCGNTKSARKMFFQDLGNKCTSQDNAINAGSIVHSAIIQDEHVNASKQLDGEMGSCDKIVGNVFQNLSSIGQA
ncbi:PREDICTED: uncharacterized protein LOC101313740 [Fragaria vesca subsp. vesca]|uniref:uncharacterized protein LOC101313740 n=1 Tax=Fragaria vesca subsp. vesca TaxID=101020 RepID=UPI0002C2F2C3|nr:PREDICTED: uncharacterized protein LOC101313740 [Fragaria vesca subsp. vesca]